MINKYARFYSHPWTVLKFPKRNTAMLYNSVTKEYDFYSLKPVSENAPPAQKTKSTYPVKMFMFLAGALGVSLALNVIKMFM